jgi:hypothetical protein
MRSLLGLLLSVSVLLVSCGDDGADASSDPPAPSSRPVLVSGTAAGGDPARLATPLADRAAVAAYVRQFSDPFASKLTSAIDRIPVPSDSSLVAAVVAIGCDVPPGVDVERTIEGVVIEPHRLASPHQECFAPVTTVALAAVDDPQ